MIDPLTGERISKDDFNAMLLDLKTEARGTSTPTRQTSTKIPTVHLPETRERPKSNSRNTKPNQNNKNSQPHREHFYFFYLPSVRGKVIISSPNQLQEEVRRKPDGQGQMKLDLNFPFEFETTYGSHLRHVSPVEVVRYIPGRKNKNNLLAYAMSNGVPNLRALIETEDQVLRDSGLPTETIDAFREATTNFRKGGSAHRWTESKPTIRSLLYHLADRNSSVARSVRNYAEKHYFQGDGVDLRKLLGTPNQVLLNRGLSQRVVGLIRDTVVAEFPKFIGLSEANNYSEI